LPGQNQDIPLAINQPTGQPIQGKPNYSMEAQNSYISSLYDPHSWAEINITILGDPDFLMRETATGVNEVYKQFYQSDSFTINPNGGQVFIEIAFNEGIDYGATINGNDIIPSDNGTGVMTINDSIFFWDYPDSVKTGPNALKGVSYQVRECESVFKGGKFTQTLQLNINQMPEAVEAAEKAESDRSANNARAAFAAIDPRRIDLAGDVRTGTSQAGSTPTPGTNTNNSSASTGLVQDNASALTSSTQRAVDATVTTVNNALGGTGITLTGNASNPIVASGELEAVGKTIAGIANNVEAAGREVATRVGNILPSTRTGTTSTDTPINFNVSDRV
jgi:hypothetical protein